MQLMQVYVQKSIRTIRSRSAPSDSALPEGVLNQRCVSANSGAGPRSRSVLAVASRLAWLAPGASACTLLAPPWHAEDPFAGAKRGRWPVSSCRRPVTASEHSSEAVRLTSGMLSATNWSKLTSRLVTIATAVATMTTPSTRCSAGPRPARRTRSSSRRPPRHRASSTSAEPAAYAIAITIDLPDAALTEMTAARIGLAHGE